MTSEGTKARRHEGTKRAVRRAFSLVELLLAIGILGIGMISIAALFPAGIAQQRQSTDDVMGPIVANSAIGMLRTKLSPDDFGRFEEFNAAAVPYTIEGDWPWLRPTFLFGDDAMFTAFPNGDPIDDTGAIDIFGAVPYYGISVNNATEFGTAPFGFYGIPWNTFKWGTEPPRIQLYQRDRYYPPQSDFFGVEQSDRPQYVWDCMFRRYQGRILVAIFVYRVSAPGGGATTYSVAPNPSSPGIPPLPVWLDMTTTATGALYANDNPVIPMTDPGAAYNPLDQSQAWQLPRQWLLDQNNNIHRVLSGRRRVTDGPVEFVQPVPRMPSASDWLDGGGNPVGPQVNWPWFPDVDGQVTSLWYIPAEDGNGVQLTPIYMTVKEL